MIFPILLLRVVSTRYSVNPCLAVPVGEDVFVKVWVLALLLTVGTARGATVSFCSVRGDWIPAIHGVQRHIRELWHEQWFCVMRWLMGSLRQPPFTRSPVSTGGEHCGGLSCVPPNAYGGALTPQHPRTCPYLQRGHFTEVTEVT